MNCWILLVVLIGPRLLQAKVRLRKAEEHYCIVREQKFSYEFDFTVLNRNEDYVIKHDEGVYLSIHVCDQLKKPCNGMDGYSICLSKEGKEIGIGLEPPKIVKEFGNIIFKYTGEPCDKRNNYTVNIKMICDLAVKDGNAITLYAAGYNECDFNMNWRTEAACVKEKKQIKCSVDDETGHYDLSELTNLSDNYQVFITDDKEFVILNVCHSVLYGPYTCKSTNAACLIDNQKEEARIKNLGEPTENLKRNHDGTLTLTYKEGALCSDNSPNAPLTMSTTITFICDLNAISTLPQYAGGKEKCHFNFTWKTASACSEEALHNKSLEQKNINTCAVRDPITDYLYNFTNLMNIEHSVKPFGTNEVYRFSICGSISNTTCKKGTGACKLHKNHSGGIGNSKLMWKESGPYLNYTNGELCSINKQQRYTILEFYCGGTDMDYEIDENDLCFDVIKISTDLACNKQKRVCTTNNYGVNFEPLILRSNNYLIKTSDAHFHINVCRPLVSESGLNCPEGAGLCKITIIDGKPNKTLNLGYPDQNPILSTFQSAVLVYRNGSVCEEDKTRRIESSISFVCNVNNELGNPTFKSYSNCTYFFEWKTNIVCGKIYGIFHENCTITNLLGDFRNLSLLTEYQSPISSVLDDKGTEVSKISLCGKRDCKGGYICDEKINYGTKVSVLTDYAVNFVRLDFTEGSECSDGSRAKSTLTIICNDHHLSAPTLLTKEPCRADFEWQTSKICKSAQKKINSIATTKVNGVEITGIIIFVLLLLAAIFYVARRSHLIEMISNSTSRNCDRVKYSRVNTMEECHLLLNTSDPTVIETDSDDDELLDA